MGRTWDPTVPVMILACGMVTAVYSVTGGLAPGQWRATTPAGGSQIRLELRLGDKGSQWSITEDVAVRELEGYDAATFSRSGAPVRVAWKRDAGSFVLEGTGGRRAHGDVRFEPSAAFREGWAAMGLAPLEDRDLLTMAFSEVRLADVQKLKESGVTDLDARTVIDLARDSDLMRWVTELHGRDPALGIHDIVRLRNHGLGPDTYMDYRQVGLSTEVEDIIRLSNHGVSPEYAAAVKASGLRDPEVEDVIRLHNHGVDTDYVKALVESGIAGASLEGIIRLHAHGVDTDYAKVVASIGPGERSVDDAIRLHNSGVSTEFMRQRNGDGTKRVSTEGTIRSWARGGGDVN